MENFESDSLTGGGNSAFSSGASSFASGNTSGGSGSSPSAGAGNMLQQSPFGRLSAVLGEEGLSKIFSGLGDSSGSSPFGSGGGSPMNGGDLPYGGNPFAGDNFWNIFAGGVNPANASSFTGDSWSLFLDTASALR